MSAESPEQPPQLKTKRSRPAPKWLLACLRAEQEGWNLVHEHAPSFTRAWFEWLNWIVILAALQVVATKYHSRIAAITCWASFWIIYYHFHSIYSRNTPEIVDPVTGVRRQTMVGWLIAFVPAAALATVSLLLAGAVSRAMP